MSRWDEEVELEFAAGEWIASPLSPSFSGLSAQSDRYKKVQALARIVCSLDVDAAKDLSKDNVVEGDNLDLAGRHLYSSCALWIGRMCVKQRSVNSVMSLLEESYPNVHADFPELRSIATRTLHGSLEQPSDFSTPNESLGRLMQKFFVRNWRNYFPPLIWIPSYRPSLLLTDLLAGITVAFLAVPQGMAYGVVAGLPPEVGLYTCTIPTLVYALLGTSRQLSLGSAALIALLVNTTLLRLPANISLQDKLQANVDLTLYVGIFMMAAGLLRFGFLENFISRPFLGGFLSASALVIQMSQFASFFGTPSTSDSFFFAQLTQWIRFLPSTKWPTFLCSIISSALLLLLDHLNRKNLLRFGSIVIPIPSALIVTGIGILVSYLANFEAIGIRIIGSIPAGFNKISVPSFANFSLFYVDALVLSLVIYINSCTISTKYAQAHKYVVDSSQEFLAIGATNLVGSFFSCMCSCGIMSRSAVANEAGARSPLYGAICAVFVIIILIVATPALYYLPYSCLAAIIIISSYSMWDFMILRHLWDMKRMDCIIWGVTFLLVLLLGSSLGLLLALGLTLLIFIWEKTRTEVVQLGRRTLAGYQIQYEEMDGEVRGDVLVVRVCGDLFFGNAVQVSTHVAALRFGGHKSVRCVVIDLSSSSYMDSSAALEFEKLNRRLLREANVAMIVLAGCRDNVQRLLDKAGALKADVHLAKSVEEAIQLWEGQRSIQKSPPPTTK